MNFKIDLNKNFDKYLKNINKIYESSNKINEQLLIKVDGIKEEYNQNKTRIVKELNNILLLDSESVKIEEIKKLDELEEEIQSIENSVISELEKEEKINNVYKKVSAVISLYDDFYNVDGKSKEEKINNILTKLEQNKENKIKIEEQKAEIEKKEKEEEILQSAKLQVHLLARYLNKYTNPKNEIFEDYEKMTAISFNDEDFSKKYQNTLTEALLSERELQKIVISYQELKEYKNVQNIDSKVSTDEVPVNNDENSFNAYENSDLNNQEKNIEELNVEKDNVLPDIPISKVNNQELKEDEKTKDEMNLDTENDNVLPDIPINKDNEQELNEEVVKPIKKGKKMNSKLKALLSIVAGVAVGSTVALTTGPVGIVIMEGASIALNHMINEWREDNFNYSLIGKERKIVGIEEAGSALKMKLINFKNKVASNDDLIKNISYGLKGAMVSGITVGFGSGSIYK